MRPAAVVENKRLGAALAVIQSHQAARDRAKLASKKLSLNRKDRLREARSKAGAPQLEDGTPSKNRTSLLGRKADISTWV